MIPPVVLDILFVLIAAIFVVVGVRRGFIKSLIQSLKFVLAIVITYLVGPATGKLISGMILKPIHDWISSIGVGAAEAALPEQFRPEAMNESIGQEVQPFAEQVSGLIGGVLGYIVTFILALIVLTIGAWLLTKLADKITFLGKANSILGGVFGALMGIIVLIIIAVIINWIDIKHALYPNTVIVKFLGDIVLP